MFVDSQVICSSLLFVFLEGPTLDPLAPAQSKRSCSCLCRPRAMCGFLANFEICVTPLASKFVKNMNSPLNTRTATHPPPHHRGHRGGGGGGDHIIWGWGGDQSRIIYPPAPWGPAAKVISAFPASHCFQCLEESRCVYGDRESNAKSV